MRRLNKVLVMQEACILMLLLCFAWSQVQYPPLKPGQEIKVNGIHIIRGKAKFSLGLTVQDMEDLIYGTGEIPGFIAVPNPYNGNHTNILIDGEGMIILNPVEYSLSEEYTPIMEKYSGSSIRRMWFTIEASEEYHLGLKEWHELHKQGYISVDVRIYDRPINYQVPEGFPRKPRAELPVGKEAYWVTDKTLMFSIGRVYVIIEAHDKGLAEALAFGIEYRIQQHPKRLVMAQKPTTVLVSNQPVAQGKAVSLAGVTVAPISALSPAQVSFKINRTSKEWTVIASRNGKWVKLKAFSWDMEMEKGKVKLERPVFPYKGELIVPLRQVSESLGISVQQKGQTIALLPK